MKVYRKLLKNVRLRMLVLIIFIAFAGVVLFVNFSFRYYRDSIQDISSELVTSNLSQAGERVEAVYMDLLKLSRVVSEDETILATIKDDKTQYFPQDFQRKTFAEFTKDDYYRYSRIRSRLQYYWNNFLFPYNSHVSLITADGLVCNLYNSEEFESEEYLYNYYENLAEESWFQEFHDSINQLIWIAPFQYVEKNGSSYLMMAYKIPSGNQRYEAILIGCINLDILNDIFHDRFPVDTYLFSADDRLIYSKVNEKRNPNPKVGTGYEEFLEMVPEEYLIYHYNFRHFGLKMSAIMESYDSLIFQMGNFQKSFITLSIVIFGFMILCIFIVFQHFTLPLKKLIRKLKSEEYGILRIDKNADEEADDISEIVANFEGMFRHINILHEQMMEEQKLRFELKYNTLKAQINPHFLFNTLNVIKWQAVVEKNDKIAEMLTDLGRLLEASMSRTEEDIPLEEELRLLECYMKIQNMRFHKNYVMEIICDESLYSYRVPKLILQPIVENSIVHGFQGNRQEEKIQVEVSMEFQELLIKIKDNGCGIEPERLNQIRSTIYEDSTGKKFNGIGISNIHQRLQLKYGMIYGLTITSDSSGTCVCVNLPAQE